MTLLVIDERRTKRCSRDMGKEIDISIAKKKSGMHDCTRTAGDLAGSGEESGRGAGRVPMGKRPQILTLQKHVYMHLMHRSPFYIYLF